MDCRQIKVVKQDGTREDFTCAEGAFCYQQSAERAMITFSRAERILSVNLWKKGRGDGPGTDPHRSDAQHCRRSAGKVNPLVAKVIGTTAIISRILCGCWMLYTRKAVHYVHWR